MASTKSIQVDIYPATITQMMQMTPADFEQFIAKLYAKMGYQTRVTRHSGDNGIDIELRKDGKRFVVQCKRYKGMVGEPIVREFFGSFATQAEQGFIVTTGTFSKAARAWATSRPLRLIDGRELMQLLQLFSPDPVIKPASPPKPNPGYSNTQRSPSVPQRVASPVQPPATSAPKPAVTPTPQHTIGRQYPSPIIITPPPSPSPANPPPNPGPGYGHAQRSTPTPQRVALPVQPAPSPPQRISPPATLPANTPPHLDFTALKKLALWFLRIVTIYGLIWYSCKHLSLKNIPSLKAKKGRFIRLALYWVYSFFLVYPIVVDVIDNITGSEARHPMIFQLIIFGFFYLFVETVLVILAPLSIVGAFLVPWIYPLVGQWSEGALFFGGWVILSIIGETILRYRYKRHNKQIAITPMHP